MLDDIRCRGGLNIVRDSEATCGSVPHQSPGTLSCYVVAYIFFMTSSKYMWMDGLVQLLMMLAKPRTKLIHTNWNTYYMLNMLMLTKISEPL